MDSFLNVLCAKIYMLCIENRILILSDMHAYAKTELSYFSSKSSLWRILLPNKLHIPNKLLMKREDVIVSRARYLRAMKRNDKVEHRPVVYVDEIYIHESYLDPKC